MKNVHKVEGTSARTWKAPATALLQWAVSAIVARLATREAAARSAAPGLFIHPIHKKGAVTATKAIYIWATGMPMSVICLYSGLPPC